MMQTLKRYQNIIIIVVVLIVGFFAYTYFFTGKDEAVLVQEEVGGTVSADQDLISLLLELKSITLDEGIFTNQTFMSLQDFSKELIPEPIGRVNPFAPLGSSGGGGVESNQGNQ